MAIPPPRGLLSPFAPRLLSIRSYSTQLRLTCLGIGSWPVFHHLPPIRIRHAYVTRDHAFVSPVPVFRHAVLTDAHSLSSFARFPSSELPVHPRPQLRHEDPPLKCLAHNLKKGAMEWPQRSASRSRSLQYSNTHTMALSVRRLRKHVFA